MSASRPCRPKAGKGLVVKKFKQTPHLAGCVAGEGGEGYGHQEEEEKLEEDGFGTATSNQILS